MSTRYISALLSPDRTLSVLGIRPGRTQRCQQFGQLRIVGSPQPDREVRALTGGQQLESALTKLPGRRQVDGTETGEPPPEQVIKAHPENSEYRDTQQRLAV